MLSMSSAPGLVSVVIPTYNRAGLVRQAVESALAQTHAGVQIIVVDDGSTDSTLAALEPLRNDITYVFQENRGRSAARNAGFALAKGEFLVFLDSDDLLPPQALENQLRFLRDHPAVDIMFGDASFLTDDGSLQPMNSCSMKLKNADPQSFLSALLEKNRFALHTALVRRAALDEAPFDETLDALEDWDLWLRLALRGRVFRCHAECVAIYRRHAENTDIVAPHRLVRASVIICTKVVAQDLDGALPPRMRQNFRLSHLDAILLSGSPRTIWRALATIICPRGQVSAYGLRRLPLQLAALVPRMAQVAVRVVRARLKAGRSTVFFPRQ
jgi:glycosyltransferase involved in cell wall biosynthesis